MDCAADERLVRLALEADPTVHRVETDLSARQIVVVHDSDPASIALLVRPLNFGAMLLDSLPASEIDAVPHPRDAHEGRTLRIVLTINAAMFAAEIGAAVWADSSALLADSLDMFADATVYAIALYGVGRARSTQLTAARLSGVLQLLLAIGALTEVARRVMFGSEPEAPFMVVIGLLALLANATCLWLLARHRHSGAHMTASWIFTTNDVIANMGVIVAAGLVRLFHSNLPDLAVATIIAIVVFYGALRILRLKV